MIDKELLKEILSIPTYFGREERIKDFLIGYGIKNGIPVKVDNKGNIYFIKGQLDEGESYPCVVAHMDTVHLDQIPDIEADTKLDIHEEISKLGVKLWASRKEGKKSVVTGIGGDDKAGIFICLEIMKKFDKIIGAFFVEEEFGCKGSEYADEEILKDVGYFMQFDAPYDYWCSFSSNGIQLFNEEIYNKIKSILSENNIKYIGHDPYTDIFKLKIRFDVACMNFFAGYHHMHTKNEFVVIENVEKAVKMGSNIIKTLGFNKHEMVDKGKVDHKLFNKIQVWLETHKNENII